MSLLYANPCLKSNLNKQDLDFPQKILHNVPGPFLIQNITHQIPFENFELGRKLAYFYDTVRILVLKEGEFIAAHVLDGSPFEVMVTADQKNLQVFCTCRAFQDTFKVCPHISAVLLMASWNHYFRELEEPQEVNLVSVKEPQLPNWKIDIARIKNQLPSPSFHSTSSPLINSEIVYIVDVTQTFSNHTLTIEAAFREKKKDGTWGKTKMARIKNDSFPELPDSDQALLSYLAAIPENLSPKKNPSYSYQSYSYRNYSYRGYYGGYYIIPADRVKRILPQICQSGKAFLRETNTLHSHPLQWEEGKPWGFSLEFSSHPPYFIGKGVLSRKGEKIPLDQPSLLAAGGAVFFPDRAALLEDSGVFPWIVMLCKKNEIQIHENEKENFLAELLSLPQLPLLELPEEFKITKVSSPPKPNLHLKSPDLNLKYRPTVFAKLSFSYNGLEIYPQDPRHVLFHAGEREIHERNFIEENQAQKLLLEHGFRLTGKNGGQGWELPISKLNKTVKVLVEKEWHVEAEGKLFRPLRSSTLKISTEIDWFELDGQVDFEGSSVPFPKILEAVRKKENTVVLDDGTVGILPEEWLQQYGLLSSLAEIKDGTVTFSKNQAGFLDALLSLQPEIKSDERFSKIREKLQNFTGIKGAEPPLTFQGTLREYQKIGLGWLFFLQEFGFGGILADDMGLGKTIQILALLAARKNSNKEKRIPPSLAVVPKSLIFNWKQEARRFTPDLRILDHTGTSREKNTNHFKDYDLVLTTYGTLRKDIFFLKDYPFDYLILDESQAIKNPNSDSAKAARLLSGQYRVALTGTPVENHLGELWSQFEFLNPSILGNSSLFQKLSGGETRSVSEENKPFLSRSLRPFLLRRRKEDVAPELPAKTEQLIYCEMEGKQKEMYAQLREYYRRSLLKQIDTEGIAKTKIQILEALLRLRQAACHPGLLDESLAFQGSAKLDALFPQLFEVIEEGHKALVFSQFTKFLALVRNHLEKEKIPYEYLDGKTTDREGVVNHFEQDPECKIFLISLKAGGFGLNLTSAEYVFLLDPWWNPAVESQAVDRTHRIGQTKPVFAYRLIAKGTVEEKVLALQETKKELAQSILEEGDNLIRNMTVHDLELLLS